MWRYGEPRLNYRHVLEVTGFHRVGKEQIRYSIQRDILTPKQGLRCLALSLKETNTNGHGAKEAVKQEKFMFDVNDDEVRVHKLHYSYSRVITILIPFITLKTQVAVANIEAVPIILA